MKKRLVLPMLLILLVSGCAGQRLQQYQESLTQQLQTVYAQAEGFSMTADLHYAEDTDRMKVQIEINSGRTGKIEFTGPDDIRGFSFGMDENGAYFAQDEQKFAVEGGFDTLPDPLKQIFNLSYYIQNGSFDIREDTTTVAYENVQDNISVSLEIDNETQAITSVSIAKGNQTATLDIIEFSIR